MEKQKQKKQQDIIVMECKMGEEININMQTVNRPTL